MKFVQVEYKAPLWIKTKESSLVIIPGWGSCYLSDLQIGRHYDGRPWINGKTGGRIPDTLNTSLKCVRDLDVRARLLTLLEERERCS